MKHMRRWISLLIVLTMVLPMITIPAKAQEEGISVTEKKYRIWYDEEAPQTMKGFEEWSLPIGNGYMGLNVFGGVETELISVTENSMFNPYVDTGTTTPGGEERCKSATGGLSTLAKTYIDFNHSNVSNYQRDLVLNDAIATVSYDAGGVHYTREYFSTYPDKVSVMRLTASQSGALTFTLRPIAPYVHDYLDVPGDGKGKTGKTVAEGDTVIVSGMMDWYDINYEAMYKVIPQGGTMVAANDENGENGKITVTGADSAIILLAVGTNYHMEEESFISGNSGVKMDANEYPHEKVAGYIEAAAQKSYDQLLAAHEADYKYYYDRAKLDLGGVYNAAKTTDQLLTDYKNGNNDLYLEELLFQYGRYLLIASSREGCLPANLQGIWNFGDSAAWSGGYWHNINVQMNYWPAFNTNLIELFQSYVDFNETFRGTTEGNADYYLKAVNPEAMDTAGTGQNGWAVGTNVSPYRASAPGTTGHSGPGTGAFTSLLFWDYYDFTRDETILEEHTYPAIEGMANFLSKTLKEYDGKWLVASSASPENNIGTDANGKYIYYRTVGTAFDQQMVYENHLVTLKAAELLGYTAQDHPLLATLQEQIDHLDPVNVGYSGQVKEYREENYYSDIGDPNHRHISQLVGLYPGTAINGTTDAWLDAARTTLNLRGDGTTGWSICHRLLAWARLLDGERSYQLIEKLMTTRTNTNLWTTHPPFQIDSNFGYTAAVAEMLVQSHAGYIEFLPALPSAWATGSFEGLTTRGAFEVDAVWTNGQATKFVVKSNAGEEAIIKYQNIATATVVDSKGNPVTLTKEGTDLIRFATTEGETYTITNISATVKVAAPKTLSVTATGSAMKLTWTASSDAVSYNVYRAVNDAATYEQVATGVTGTTYNYTANDITGADRVTMRVTAVGASGRESVGVLSYSLPVEPPETVTGNMIGTKLQLEISGGEGEAYRVYENGVQVCETPYTVAVVENADINKTYTVSTVTEGRESAAMEVAVQTAASENILLGKPLAHSDNVAVLGNGKYPLSLGVDGVIETKTSSIKRWAVTDQKEAYTVTADLQGTYKLDVFTFWEWLPNEKTTRSDNTKLEVLTPAGEWVTMKSGFALNPGKATEVDMGGVIATKIRMTFENTKAAKSASITEITCSTLPMDVVDKTELYALLDNFDSVTGGVKLAQITAKAPAEAVLQDPNATQTEVDKAARDVENALTKTNIFKKKTVTTDVPAYNNNTSKYGAAMMVDENYSTRFAANDTGPSVTATVTLDGMYHIEGIFVQEYLDKGKLTRGKDVTIEVYDGEKWVTVVSGATLSSTPDTPGTFPTTTAFVLNESVKGNQVRLSFVNNENKRITIYELQAYGQKVNTTGVSLSASVINATAGKTVNLTAGGTVTSWKSSDSSVVSVDASGKITALAEGTATVTVTGSDGSTASCFITVENDKTPMTDAIAAAKTALEGVSGIDKTADKVISGKKFVPTAVYEQLNKALNDAETALPNANTAQIVQTHAEAIHTALTAFNAAMQTGTMADNHTCENKKWTAWGDSAAEKTTLPTTGGNYYLVDNIVLSAEQKVSAGAEVYLCLNGYNVTCADNNIYSVFGLLHIYDCAEQPGTISGGDTTNGGTFYVGNTGTLTIHGGTMTASSTAESGGIAYIAAGGTMEMYGGTITGGHTTNYGGNVSNFGTFKLVDGTIEKGSTSGNAGNFYNRGTFEMTGGSIVDPAKHVNMLLTTGSTTTISGGVLRGNTTYNIRIWDAGVLNVTGGEILSGSFSANGSGIYTDKGGTVNITGGTVSNVSVNMIKETEGATNNAKNAASLTIENATVQSLYLADANATYDPQITFAGKAVVEKLTANGVPVTFQNLCDGAAVTYKGAAAGAVIGTGDSAEYIYGDNGLVPILENTTLTWGTPRVFAVAGDTQTGYATIRQAAEAGDYVMLTGDVTEDVVVNEVLYLDLNGHTLTGNVTGDGTLYGMDASTDKYTTENMGRIEGTVSCVVAKQFKTNVTGAVRRYMAIADAEGYTFHRFWMGITHMNLKPGVTGVGYKAAFYGDEQVRQQVAGYGYTLWIGENGKKLTAGKEETFVSGKTVTARLQNFDVENYGEAEINGSVYLKLSDGTIIESGETSYTLRSLVEIVAADQGSYTAAQLSALRTMLLKFEDAVSSWNIADLLQK